MGPVDAAKSGRTSRSWSSPMLAAPHWPAGPRSAGSLAPTGEPLSVSTLAELDDGALKKASGSPDQRRHRQHWEPGSRIAAVSPGTTVCRSERGTESFQPCGPRSEGPVFIIPCWDFQGLMPRGEVNKTNAARCGPCRAPPSAPSLAVWALAHAPLQITPCTSPPTSAHINMHVQGFSLSDVAPVTLAWPLATNISGLSPKTHCHMSLGTATSTSTSTHLLGGRRRRRRKRRRQG